MLAIILDSLVPVFFGMALGYVGGCGLPLISALLGADHLVAAAVAIACGSIVVSPITLLTLERTSQRQDRRGFGSSVVSTLKNPIVLAPLLAVAFVLTGIGLPDFLTRSFSLMGQVAGGAGLFLTRLILSAQKLGLGANAGIQTLLSNVAHPLLAAAGVAFRHVCAHGARGDRAFGSARRLLRSPVRAALQDVIRGRGNDADRERPIERRDSCSCDLSHRRNGSSDVQCTANWLDNINRS
jgi:predicted permease